MHHRTNTWTRDVLRPLYILSMGGGIISYRLKIFPWDVPSVPVYCTCIFVLNETDQRYQTATGKNGWHTILFSEFDYQPITHNNNIALYRYNNNRNALNFIKKKWANKQSKIAAVQYRKWITLSVLQFRAYAETNTHTILLHVHTKKKRKKLSYETWILPGLLCNCTILRTSYFSSFFIKDYFVLLFIYLGYFFLLYFPFWCVAAMCKHFTIFALFVILFILDYYIDSFALHHNDWL